MKEFKKYQHLEKFGSTEVNGIECGLCYVFPKIDGTNASLWFERDSVQAGSRNRHLTLDKDNAGFMEYAVNAENVLSFFKEYPDLRLFGEWLVPHTLKTYIDSAWRKFYVFDVRNGETYVEYEEYKEMLDKHDIEYIVPLCKISNPTDERLYGLLENNNYLIKDGEGSGEGIVIKNYQFENKFGNIVWAKMVRSEFKVKNQKVFGIAEIKEKNIVEEEIVAKYVTEALINKEHAKIETECGWSSRMIPRLLNTVFYCLVKEESWNFVKELKNPTVNFKRLQSLTIMKIKSIKPELFWNN